MTKVEQEPRVGAETETTVMGSWGCPCGHEGPGHDWVLGLEDRGIEGIVELIDRFEITWHGEAEDFGFDPIPVGVDLNEMVARHNWRQPAIVERLVDFIVTAERARMGRS